MAKSIHLVDKFCQNGISIQIHINIIIFSAELFHELSKALEVLTDPKAKAAYDAVLKAKERARLRTQALDAKRKKFKQGKLLQTIPKQ